MRTAATLSLISVLLLSLAACRGDRPADSMITTTEQLSELVDSLLPSVAAAAGMPFKEKPRSEIRSTEELHRFVLDRLEQELPPRKVRGLSAAYSLLGMIPDTLDLIQLFQALYGEQVAGYYDPDSSALYFVARGEPTQLRFLLAHEMDHALQHQYTPVDSILKDRSNSDRAAAAQAVLEGHAQLVAFLTLLPGQNILDDDGFLATVEEQVRVAQSGMPVFNSAPLVIREGLIAPYLRGTEFVRWFRQHHPGKQPFNELMPVSTEQLLHPERYASGDQPIQLSFVTPSDGVLHEDTFGEQEISVLRSVLAGIDEVPVEVPIDWGGDRYRVFESDQGAALVWYTVWDTVAGATRFLRQIGDPLLKVERPGYRTVVEAHPIGSQPGVRVVIAPKGWQGWEELPPIQAVAGGVTF